MTMLFGLASSALLTVPLVWFAYRPGKHATLPAVPQAAPDRPAIGAADVGPLAAVVAAAVVPDEDAEHAAIRYAFDECGLPLHKLTDDFDVAATGKLNDVYHHASVKLGHAHPVRTVQAIAAHLKLVK